MSESAESLSAHHAQRPRRSSASRAPAAFLTLAFRPFFLGASLWSAVALALWMSLLMGDAHLPSRFDPLTWHIHEMLFGFVLAAIAGFLLTAIPNWTGRPPLRGAPLAALAVLWLLGRIVCGLSALLPYWLAAALDLAFPFALCALAAREIIAARNWRNLAIPLPIGVLGIADLLMYLAHAGIRVPAGLGWRLGLAAIIVLISVIGGRIVPAFTRNWLLARRTVAPAARTPHGTSHGMPLPRTIDALRAIPLPMITPLVERVSLGTLHAGLLGWVFFPHARAVAALLLAAAALNAWRLARWRGWMTLAEPLLTVLHVGYVWIVLGAALLGLSLLTPAVPTAAAIHALTAGAIGTMILAVMTRVARGHTGRPLRADRVTLTVYGIIVLAALLRLLAPIIGAAYLQLLSFSAALWVAGFLLFALRYAPMLIRPRLGAPPT